MNWLSVASIPVALVILWFYTSQLSKSFPTLQGKRICLLIAHPDDEAMFFAPTVLALTRPELGNHLKILCMSTGDADGLGDIRKKELEKSALLLGLRSSDDVLILDDPNFPDSITTTWDARLLSNFLMQTFAPKMASIPPHKAPEASIDVLITFDRNGVSGHPNHKSLYEGGRTFIQQLMHRHRGWECPITLYTLSSVNMVRKYGSVLDFIPTMATAITRRKEKGSYPTPLLFASSPMSYKTARTAMTQAHQSQMVWFRWGWIGLSRYMIVNDLVKQKSP